MLIWIARILAVLFGAAFLYLGGMGWIAPERLATNFQMIAPNATAASAVRADFGAFFLAAGACAVLGAGLLRRDLLLAAMLLVGLALLGRLVGLLLAPSSSDIINSMLIELVWIGIMGFCWSMIGRQQAITRRDDPNG